METPTAARVKDFKPEARVDLGSPQSLISDYVPDAGHAILPQEKGFYHTAPAPNNSQEPSDVDSGGIIAKMSQVRISPEISGSPVPDNAKLAGINQAKFASAGKAEHYMSPSLRLYSSIFKNMGILEPTGHPLMEREEPLRPARELEKEHFAPAGDVADPSPADVSRDEFRPRKLQPPRPIGPEFQNPPATQMRRELLPCYFNFRQFGHEAQVLIKKRRTAGLRPPTSG